MSKKDDRIAELEAEVQLLTVELAVARAAQVVIYPQSPIPMPAAPYAPYTWPQIWCTTTTTDHTTYLSAVA